MIGEKETRESFPNSEKLKKNYDNTENRSSKMKITNSSNSNRSNFFLAGKMILNEKINEDLSKPKTEVVIRTRNKNNNLQTKKGYVEISNEEYKVLLIFLFIFFIF